MKFSRLMLGTVQFGLPYGIANTHGQPTLDDVCAIIKAAFDGGVNTLDTAAIYGNSEEVIGMALERLGLQGRMAIISKIPPINVDNEAAALAFIKTSLRASLQRLRVPSIAVCLLHREDDIHYLPLLEKMVAGGLTCGAGVSLDTSKYLAVAGQARFIQLPHNLLDYRFAPLWPTVTQNGITVFARSAYLQGLLLMPEEKILPALHGVIAIRQKLENLAREAGITMSELCFRFSLSHPHITSVLTGVETLAQMEENLRLASLGPLPADLLRHIAALVPQLPENIVRPALWPKRPVLR